MSKGVISDKLRKDMEAQFKGSRSLEGGSKIPYYKVDNDSEMHSFRVLPGEFGESKELWFLGVAQHWVKKENNRIPLYCPRMDGGDCPFCNKMDEYRKEENAIKEAMKSRELKADKAKYKKVEGELKVIQKIISYAAPRSSYMINVLDRDDSNVKVFSAPKSVFQKIMSYFSEDGPQIFDVEDGHDFRIKKKKKGRSVEYTVELVPSKKPVKPTEAGIQDTLDKRHDLEALIKFEESEKLEDFVEDGVSAILNGLDSGDDSEGDEGDHHHHRENGSSRDRGDDDNIAMEHAGDREREERHRERESERPREREREREPEREREREREPERERESESDGGGRRPTGLLSRMRKLKDDE